MEQMLLTSSTDFFKLIFKMKVVISESGLAIYCTNISGAIQDMKIPKLELCRGRLRLSCHVKIYVTTCVFFGGRLWWNRGPTFFQWYHFALLRVQFGRELVRLLILINITSAMSLKKYSRITF